MAPEVPAEGGHLAESPEPVTTAERLARMRDAFRRLGPDPLENMNLLTALCGEMLGGRCALYNRLRGDLLCAWAGWRVPPDHDPEGPAEGHICYDVVRSGRLDTLVVRNLQETAYARTDPHIRAHGLQTYVGCPVWSSERCVGSLCVAFRHDFELTEEDDAILGILASAIGVEERRREEQEALRHGAEFERLIRAISAEFINLDSSEIDAGVSRALERIGRFAGVDRSYVFLLSDDGLQMSNTHEWCEDGIQPARDRLQRLPVKAFPWIVERLLQGEAVHVPRVREMPPEADAEREEFETEGIRSLVSVPMVRRGRTLGFVGFDSVRGEKAWSDGDIDLLRLVGGLFANALDRKQAERRVRASLREKEALLREVHHRVKNNLQICSSLLGLQAEAMADESTREALADSQNRIRSMAQLHEQLYGSGSRTDVDMGEYVAGLVRNVADSCGNPRVALHVDAEDADLDADKAILCGLIINELVTNAFKHAFAGDRPGEIRVSLRRAEEGGCRLSVSDDGPGLPPEMMVGDASSLGLRLVSLLTRQLEGKVSVGPRPGANFTVTFS